MLERLPIRPAPTTSWLPLARLIVACVFLAALLYLMGA